MHPVFENNNCFQILTIVKASALNLLCVLINPFMIPNMVPTADKLKLVL
jgi:hypothetical protein